MQTPDGISAVIRVVTSSLGAASPLVPGLGEFLQSIVPGQRLDRIERFARHLDRRLSRSEKAIQQFKKLLSSPEFGDLLKDALRQASRAVSEERMSYIVSLIYTAIEPEQFSYAPKKKLFRLLDQLVDEELLWLRFYSLDADRPALRELMHRYPEVLSPASKEIGIAQEEVERGALQDSYKFSLIGHGLLEEQATIGGKRLQGLRISSLGKMLLRAVQPDDDPV